MIAFCKEPIPQNDYNPYFNSMGYWKVFLNFVLLIANTRRKGYLQIFVQFPAPFKLLYWQMDSCYFEFDSHLLALVATSVSTKCY